MIQNSNIFIVATLILIIAGCASEPSLGDRMLSKSDLAKGLGENWNEGNVLVIAGEKLRDRGEKQIEEGEDNVDRGEEMIEEGRSLMEESENEFQRLFPDDTLH